MATITVISSTTQGNPVFCVAFSCKPLSKISKSPDQVSTQFCSDQVFLRAEMNDGKCTQIFVVLSDNLNI